MIAERVIQGINLGEQVYLHRIETNLRGQTWWHGVVKLKWAEVKHLYFQLPMNEIPTTEHLINFEKIGLKQRLQALEEIPN